MKFLIGLLFLFAGMSAAAPVDEFALKIPRHAKKSVGVFQFNGSSIGSGFLFGDAKWVYIVTAKHVLIDPGSGKFRFTKTRFLWHIEGGMDAIPSACDIDLDEKYVNDSIFISTRDVVAVRLGRYVVGGLESPENVASVKLDIPFGTARRIMIPIDVATAAEFDKVEETLDVIVAGYPADLERIHTPEGLQFDRDWPIYRRGMVAQVNHKNRTIIIDGMVHGGNSGSPVFQTVQVSLDTKQSSFIGVVIQKMFDFSITTDSVVNGLQNAGYAVVEPADTVLALIERADLVHSKNLRIQRH